MRNDADGVGGDGDEGDGDEGGGDAEDRARNGEAGAWRAHVQQGIPESRSLGGEFLPLRYMD